VIDDAEELRREVSALAERVERLEQAARSTARSAAPPADATEAEDRFWALTELRSRLAEHATTQQGAVMLVGSLQLPDGSPVEWQQGMGTAALLQTDWSDHAAVFAALGHPVRLELLRHILTGVHATADLAALETLGTTGQLHHHLRPLVTAGWVRQSGRGTYEVPAARVVPLLVCLAGALR